MKSIPLRLFIFIARFNQHSVGQPTNEKFELKEKNLERFTIDLNFFT